MLLDLWVCEAKCALCLAGHAPFLDISYNSVTGPGKDALADVRAPIPPHTCHVECAHYHACMHVPMPASAADS